MDEELQYAVLHEFVAPARRNLSRQTWDYLMGGAETETTYVRNRLALDSLAFRPRVLRNVEKVDTGGRLLGQAIRIPVILAPIGSLQDIVASGGLAPTEAAARYGVVHMLSSACSPGLEAVAAANDHPKIFQLYVRGDQAWVDDYIQRAVASGYIALCLTVDLDYYGRRERDLAKRYKSTARRGPQADHFQARFSWADIERLKNKFDIPFILKGIATAEDTRIAIEHGIEAIYVSNHGGRQLDHGKGAMAVLPARCRHRQGHGAGRQCRRHRPAAGPGARRRRRGRAGEGAGTPGGRDAALSRPPRRDLLRRARQELRRARRAVGPRGMGQRLSAAEGRVLIVQLRAPRPGAARCVAPGWAIANRPSSSAARSRRLAPVWPGYFAQ
jgi:hypothetical protein